jgi:hypothetical protein
VKHDVNFRRHFSEILVIDRGSMAMSRGSS